MADRGSQRTEPGTASDSDGQPGRVDRRTLLKTGASGATAVSSAGCLETAGSIVGSDVVTPVRIGVLASNPDSDSTGRSIVQGARIAVDELNESGGIRGRNVEIVVGDTNGSPLEARRQYQRLILEDDVDVTVGVSTSEVIMNLMDDIAEQRTPHLSVGSATPATGKLVREQYDRYKYHFRVGPVNAVNLGETQVDFVDEMSGDLGWESVAVLAEDYAWTQAPWEVYQNRLADTGVDVVLEQRYPPATDDFSALYDEVEAAGADMALVSMAHTGTAAITDWGPPRRRFAFGGIHVPMQYSSYYRLLEGACRYGFGYASATANAEHTRKTRPFVEAFQNRYDGRTPVYTGYIAFDAVKVFGDAVDRAGALESEALVEALEETSFTGVTGTIEFYGPEHEFAHDVKYGKEYVNPIYFQWQEDDGEGIQEIIWPEAQATADYVSPHWL